MGDAHHGGPHLEEEEGLTWVSEARKKANMRKQEGVMMKKANMNNKNNKNKMKSNNNPRSNSNPCPLLRDLWPCDSNNEKNKMLNGNARETSTWQYSKRLVK